MAVLLRVHVEIKRGACFVNVVCKINNVYNGCNFFIFFYLLKIILTLLDFVLKQEVLLNVQDEEPADEGGAARCL